MNASPTARLVSVLIPVFNAERFLRQAVESALEQEETGEVLLLDDGSIDGSLSLCQLLASESELVRVIQHPGGVNRGEAASRNLLVRHSRYKYIAFLDADDYFLPGRFSVAVNVLENDPNIDVVYDAFEKRFEDPALEREWLANTPRDERILRLGPPEQVDNLFELIMTQYKITPNIWQIVARREVYESVPPFNEELLVSPDSPVLFQMLASFKFAPGQVAEPCIVYRIHDSNLYQRMRRFNPKKTRQVLLDWLKYFWVWSRRNLDAQKLEFVQIFLLRQSLYIAPLFFPTRLRPRRFFLHVQRIIGLVALPVHFREILHSRLYWTALGKTICGSGLYSR